MSRKTILLAALLVVGGWTAIVVTTPQDLFGSETSFRGGARVFRDDYDRNNFARYGRWLPEGKIPYLEAESIYPQVATYLFGLTWLLTDDLETYFALHSLLMAAFLMGLVAVTLKVLARLGVPQWRALLLVLPGSVYFSLNRYDAVPAFVVAASLLALLERRTALAFALLAVASLTKWYPLLLVPIFAHWVRCTDERRGALPRALGAFAAALGLILLTTLVSGGVAALTAPYQFFLERRVANASLYQYVGRLGLPVAELRWVFLVLQVAVVPLALVRRLTSEAQLVRWSALAILGFMLFSKHYSPQWLVWLVPFLLIGAATRLDLALLVVFDVLSWVSFAVVLFVCGRGSRPLDATHLVRIGLMLWIGARLVLQLRAAAPLPAAVGTQPPSASPSASSGP